ncbi:hypothetical protein HMPREF0379_2067 [[Eubacterium] yurii subsp. margaretiae ATCC 43715]|nr:hypothetical protein HMPREF0379_2067 [[Eubacterium] yurii subsp. margaretiae ATCC 43715]
MKMKKGYTLIEAICAYFLVILIFVTVFTLFSFLINTSSYSKADVIADFTMQNLKEKIKYELSGGNVSFIKVDEDGKSLEYEKFYKIDAGDDDYMGGKGHRLSKKKIRYISNDKKLVMITQNNIYKEKENQAGFDYVYSKEEATNILEEDVDDFDVRYTDDTLEFVLSLKKFNVDEKISFHIRGVKNRRLI